MEEIDIVITHRMVVRDKESYLINRLKSKETVAKLKTYLNVEQITFEKNKDKVYMMVYGTREMYGYMLAGGCFYDVFNDKCYHPIQLKSKEIIELSEIDGQTLEKVR